MDENNYLWILYVFIKPFVVINNCILSDYVSIQIQDVFAVIRIIKLYRTHWAEDVYFTALKISLI